MGKRREKKKGEKLSWADVAGPTRDVVQVPVDWNTMVSDEDGANAEDVQFVSIDRTDLPKAPRAAQEIPLERIPENPPFTLYMSGIPFTANEDNVRTFFSECRVRSVNMGTEDGRNRGHAVVEFEDRGSLITGLRKDDSTMGNRQVSISLDNPRDRQNRINSDRGGGASRGLGENSFIPPDDWRSNLRKRSEVAQPQQSSSSQFPGFARPDRMSKAYTGRFSDDASRRSQRPAFGTWGSGQTSSFRRNLTSDTFQKTIPAESTPLAQEEQQSDATVRKVNTEAFKALLGNREETSVPRSKSIFGNATPVDTTSKINAATQKIGAMTIKNTSSQQPARRETTQQQPNSDRPTYRPSRSEDFRSNRTIGRQPTQTTQQQIFGPSRQMTNRLQQRDFPPRQPQASAAADTQSRTDGRKPSNASAKPPRHNHYKNHCNEVANEFPMDDVAPMDANSSNQLLDNSDAFTFQVSKNRFYGLMPEEDVVDEEC